MREERQFTDDDVMNQVKVSLSAILAYNNKKLQDCEIPPPAEDYDENRFTDPALESAIFI